MKNALDHLVCKIQNFTLVRASRRALVMSIPILMIGSFAVLLGALPIPGYAAFITTWCGGLLYKLFEMARGITFGMMAVYTAAMIGYQIGVMDTDTERDRKFSTMFVSLGGFFILSGAMNGGNEILGTRGVFIAILSAGLASELYLFVDHRIKRRQLLTDGADMNLKNAIYSILPMAVTLSVIALGNIVLLTVTHQESFYQLIMTYLSLLSNHIGEGIAGGITYIVGTNLFWFFGIHGSDVMEGISDALFKQSVDQNIALIQKGQEATQIITGPFLNSFVMIGGCGATLCLLIALLLFSRRKGVHSLTKMSLVPMLFNINEIMVFGLPVIYNPIFLVPFMTVPIICFLISYFAMHMGWVPLVANKIPWTTPILINGYLSTGSLRGLALQFVDVVVGVGIYAPFVRLYDKKRLESSRSEYAQMLQKFKQCEAAGKSVRITDSNLSFGWMGKSLAADLEYAFEHKQLELFYQPQYNDTDHCIGVEALLRWNHRTLGWIYPPLIIRLAEEAGIQERLEKWIITKALRDAEELKDRYPDREIKVSINVTGASIQKKSFELFLERTAGENDIKRLHICLEVTEQDALLLDDALQERFRHLRELGYVLAVDDFSMGSTSIRYLTGSHFELVKLDGSLVSGILDNPRCCEIIASIVHLSDTLGVQVLAEYVEDERIRKKLLEVGCRLYQGWYYSPAIPLQEFEDKMDHIQVKAL